MQTLTTLLCILTVWPLAAGADADDRLAKVSVKHWDEASIGPGVDFAKYRAVRILPSQVAMRPHWLRDQSYRTPSLGDSVTEKEEQAIVAATQALLDTSLPEAIADAGFVVADTGGQDVLLLIPRVIDLDINTPDVPLPVSTASYAQEAGRATLALELRDSVSGALLARVSDRRIVGDNHGRLEWTTRVTNRADFERSFKHWGAQIVKQLREWQKSKPVFAR